MILDMVGLTSQLFESKRKSPAKIPPKEEKHESIKTKLLSSLNMYLMGLGAVIFYYFLFFVRNFHPFTKGIGLLYVLVFVLGIITLLNFAFIVLRKINTEHKSKKNIIINVAIDLALLVILNVLYFSN